MRAEQWIGIAICLVICGSFAGWCLWVLLFADRRFSRKWAESWRVAEDVNRQIEALPPHLQDQIDAQLRDKLFGSGL